jgi:hypothetical protein
VSGLPNADVNGAAPEQPMRRKHHDAERIIPTTINKSIPAKKQEAISGALITLSPLDYDRFIMNAFGDRFRAISDLTQKKFLEVQPERGEK